MRNINFRPLYNNCDNFNANRDKKPYRARNIVTNTSMQETPTTPPVQTPTAPTQEMPVEEVPVEGVPAEEGTLEVTPIPEELLQGETGYISVGVFTALGALPVPNAVVTVYANDEVGNEIVLSHQITDANGRVQDVELPVIYNRLDPLESFEYFFSTYNLRVEAPNYYTVNVLDARVFPDTKTNFRIDLIPVAAGRTEGIPEQTIVIPPSPVDISND